MARPTLPTLPAPFVATSVLKRDVFGEIAFGHLEGDPDTVVTRRQVSVAAPWVRRFAWHLAGREIRALMKLDGVDGVPKLLGVDKDALYRSWIEGTPLHVAKPKGNAAYFKDAKRLLKSLHRAGITHNDLAKPQNWLMTPSGGAALIDMQLATTFRKPNRLFRLLAREDLRHLLKQKRSYCRQALTPAEHRLLATKSVPARVWMATGKKVYNAVTRGVFNWSDGEGTRDRADTDGRAIAARFDADETIAEVVVVPFPYPKARGIGLYAFVVLDDAGSAAEAERRLASASAPRPDIVQAVAAFPRGADGAVREDLLRLVAINQVDRLEEIAGDPAALAIAREIAADRRNFTDRRLKT